MNSNRIVYVAAVLLLLVSSTSQAQKNEETDHRYKLLATTKTSTMQKELDEAASQGFRVVVGSPTSGTEMAILLERVAQPPDTYKYRLLATTRTGTMQKELNESAKDGYRLLPRTMIAKSQMIGGVEIVVLLERSPKFENRYEYKLLATNLTSTLQKEIGEAQAAGFVLAGMVSRGEHMVIMEKETPVR